MNGSLPDLISHFLKFLEIKKIFFKLKIRDYRHYLEVFEKWFTSSLPDGSLKDLDLMTVRKYRVFLANRADDKGMTLKRVTQNYYGIALRSFLRFLIKNDYQTLEPSKIDLPKTESRSLKFLERDQVARLDPSVDPSDEDRIRERTMLDLQFS